PVIRICRFSLTADPGAGPAIWETGGALSVDCVAGASSDWRVCGWTSMSANTLTVACCTFGAAGEATRAEVASDPPRHLVVPAANTNAPLGARYSDILWTVLPT